MVQLEVEQLLEAQRDPEAHGVEQTAALDALLETVDCGEDAGLR